MVEFAIVISLFLVLVMGGFEFGRMIFEWGRVVEATRIGVRTAVVSTPPAECLNAQGNLILPCSNKNPETDSLVLQAMQGIIPTLEASDIRITYTASGAGFAEMPTPIPVITVEVSGLTFEPVVAGLLGLPTTFPIPGFASSQTGESMRNLKKDE